MIQNKWKNVLSAKGMTQAQAAKAAGINAPLFSMVANGTGILPISDLESVCKVLDIEPEKVYSADVLKAIYGIEAKKQAQRSVSIKLTGEQAEYFEEVKRKCGYSEATNKEFVIKLLSVAEWR